MSLPKLTPRKAPRQVRARATVEAILGAAEQLTRGRGAADWTTNHVAERAGVSIGSLYQYFPSKESLVTALYLHRRAAHLANLASALAELGDPRPPRDAGELAAARAWIGDPVDELALDLELRELVLAAGAARKLAPLDEQAQRLLQQVLTRQGVDEAAAARRALLVLRAVEAALATAAHARMLDHAELPRDVAALLRALRP